MTLKTRFTDYVTKSIQDRNKRVAFFTQHLPDLPVEPIEVQESYGAPWLSFPYDRDLVKRLTDFMIGIGWKLEYEIKDQDCSNAYSMPRQCWQKKIEGRTEYPFEAEIIFSFSDQAEGATCKRNEIGKVTIDQSVYEFICQEKS